MYSGGGGLGGGFILRRLSQTSTGLSLTRSVGNAAGGASDEAFDHKRLHVHPAQWRPPRSVQRRATAAHARAKPETRRASRRLAAPRIEVALGGGGRMAAAAAAAAAAREGRASSIVADAATTAPPPSPASSGRCSSGRPAATEGDAGGGPPRARRRQRAAAAAMLLAGRPGQGGARRTCLGARARQRPPRAGRGRHRACTTRCAGTPSAPPRRGGRRRIRQRPGWRCVSGAAVAGKAGDVHSMALCVAHMPSRPAKYLQNHWPSALTSYCQWQVDDEADVSHSSSWS